LKVSYSLIISAVTQFIFIYLFAFLKYFSPLTRGNSLMEASTLAGRSHHREAPRTKPRRSEKIQADKSEFVFLYPTL
jgi:hypothetical protein